MSMPGFGDPAWEIEVSGRQSCGRLRGDSPGVSRLPWLLGPSSCDTISAISASTFTRPSSLGPHLCPLWSPGMSFRKAFTPTCVRCGGRVRGMRWVGGGRGAGDCAFMSREEVQIATVATVPSYLSLPKEYSSVAFWFSSLTANAGYIFVLSLGANLVNPSRKEKISISKRRRKVNKIVQNMIGNDTFLYRIICSTIVCSKASSTSTERQVTFQSGSSVLWRHITAPWLTETRGGIVRGQLKTTTVASNWLFHS